MRHSLLVSWRNITRNKKRFFLTLIAIIIGVVVMTGMLIAKETTSETLDYYEKLYAGSADYWIESNNHTFEENRLDWLQDREEFKKGISTLLKQGFVEIDGLSKAQSSVRFSGVSSFDNGLFELPVKEGDVTKEGLIITENAASLWNKELGDDITFSDMGTLKITAIVHEGSMLSSPQTLEEANYVHSRVMVPLDVLQEWSGLDGRISSYRFETAEGQSDEIFAAYQEELAASDMFVQQVVIDDRQNNDLEGLYWTFDIIAILSVFISGFIAFNMIYTNIMERRKEFAVMKSLGYTNGGVYRLVLQEIGLLAIIGTVIALPLGVAFGGYFQELLMGAIATQNITYELEILSPIITAAVIGLIFPFAAAAFPVYQAGKTPVLEAMSNQSAVRQRSRKTNIFRVVFGVVFTGIGLIDDVIAFLFLFLGLVLLYPVFMNGLQKLVSPLFKLLFQYPGEQALRSVKQFKNRNGNTSAMLAIGVSLALFMSAALESLPDGMEDDIRSTFGGDMIVQKETPWQEEEVEDIKASDGTENAQRFADIPSITWETNDGDAREFSIMSFSGHAHEQDIFRVTEETDKSDTLPGLYLGERALNEWDGEVGEVITLNTPAGASDFYVKGTVQTAHYTGYAAFAEDAMLASSLNWPEPFQLAISLDNEANSFQLQNYLWENYGDEISSISTASQNAEASVSALEGMNELMQGLLLLIIALSAIGISNTLLMNTIERTKELGVMRAIGFTKSQIKRMILAEGLIIGLTGVIVGTAYGILVIYLNSQSEMAQDLLRFSVPWVSLILAISSGILFSLAASWLPSAAASRVKVKDAISYD
ncbi:FtsX-like permease family protein [Virgibacillus sp. YIM 98842]|uniref:ABC transporter permease n=1 Tax=Virgibacillus sp. YIM 98842 TaxID=2663533 RepID=UPI0013DC8ABA|nr:FtsX-like permease family protein [Virgibacillus sp. YIM 98842]